MSLRRFYRYDRFLQIFVNERRSSSYFCKRKNMHCKIIRVQCERIYIRHVDTRLFIHQSSVGRFYFFKKKLSLTTSLVTFFFCCVSSLVTFVASHPWSLFFCQRTRTPELVPNFTGHSIIHSSVVDRSVLFLLKKSSLSLLLSSHTRSVYAHFSKVRIETTRFMPIFLR